MVLRLCRVCVTAFLLWVVLGVSPAPVSAQTDGLLHLDDSAHRFLERQKVLGRLPTTFVLHQPLSVDAARAALDRLAALGDTLSPGERRWVARLRNETPQPGASWAQSIWPALYPNGRDLAAVSGDGFALQVNPLLYATVGRARVSDDADVTTWRNTRGVRASGHVGPLFFESRLTENQERPAQVAFGDDTAPRLGFSLLQSGTTYDYFTATGVVGFRSRFFEVRFGHDRHQWGHGLQSLNVSDYAPAYDHLQIRTSVWRLQYTNLFARYTDPERVNTNDRGGNTAFPSRYGAHHQLALQLTDRLQIELFESIRFAPQTDSLVNRSGFELGYLNPIIFYRAIERELGSPDNAMLGFGGSWIAVPGWQVYGQFLLDELRVSELGSGWWGNKWGWVLGTRVVGMGSDHLSVQAEVARLRPFLYAHFYTPNAYLHYDDTLGHPAGPNAFDAVISAEYRPPSRWEAGFTAALTQRGRNPDGENIGADPSLSTRTRSRNEVDFLSGVRQTQVLVEAHVGVEVLPQLIAEAALRVTSVDDDVRGDTRVVQPYVTLRWGLPFSSARF